MRERLIYSPIIEPNTPPPIIEPTIIYEASIGDPPFNLERIEFALNQKQREWVLNRDGHRCQATCRHRCNPKDGLEVDHVMPQRYAHEMGVMPDYPENLLTKCKNAHNIKHPDRVGALRVYHQEKQNGGNSFKDMFHDREEKLRNHQIYWNDANDRTDSVRAVQLTQKAYKAGHVWPTKKGDEL